MPRDERESELLMIASHGAERLQKDIQAVFHYLEISDLNLSEGEGCVLAELPALLAEIAAAMGLPALHVELVGIADLNVLRPAVSRQGLELIFGELLANARKFHPQHRPAIEVILTHVADTVHIHVCDDGRELSPEQLMKAWQPYYQAERFFTGRVAGMGLGLPMVAMLIWRVGGSCRIYNREPGPGVGVELIVPLAQHDGSAYA